MATCDCSLVSRDGFQDLMTVWALEASWKRPKLRPPFTSIAKQTFAKKGKCGVSMRPRKRSRKNRPHEPVKRRVAAPMVPGRAVSENCRARFSGWNPGTEGRVEQRSCVVAYVGIEHALEDLWQYLIRLSMDRRV